VNEGIFLFQIFAILGFTWAAFRLGREALSALIAIEALLANFFVLKQITLFGMEVTPSDAFAIGSILSLNLLREYWGQDAAAKAARSSLLFLLFFAMMSQIHLLFQPSSHDTAQTAYLSLLLPSPRLFCASIATFFLVQRIDLKIFSALSRQISFAWRCSLSLVIVQLLDTLLFTLLGLWGTVAAPFEIILVSTLTKLIAIFLLTPLVTHLKHDALHRI